MLEHPAGELSLMCRPDRVQGGLHDRARLPVLPLCGGADRPGRAGPGKSRRGGRISVTAEAWLEGEFQGSRFRADGPRTAPASGGRVLGRMVRYVLERLGRLAGRSARALLHDLLPAAAEWRFAPFLRAA